MKSDITDIFIDIETFSSVSLPDCGVYRYAESEDFEILLFAYAVSESSPVQVVDLAQGENIPDAIMKELTEGQARLHAHNAQFERICLSRYIGRPISPGRWHCTMARAAMNGLPLPLGQAGSALGLAEGKMAEGAALIRHFCTPCKPTEANGMSARNLPAYHQEKWNAFKEYCRRDVEVEQAIYRHTKDFVTPFERGIYVMDQYINDYGALIDSAFVRNAAEMDALYKARLSVEASRITGLDNPNSVAQLKVWISDRTGQNISSLSKKELPGIDVSGDTALQRVLRIREEAGKTSTKKYDAMSATACSDSRVRGLCQYYGTRTGRWAGRLVQIQNLPQNHIKDLDFARRCVIERDMDMLELGYRSVSDVLSQLVRTAFVAPEGKQLAVCDFSAIEARVLAWLAGEEWVLDIFRGSGRIYEATAAKMFRCSPDEITKTDPRRQKGKIAVLALGYGGGVNALKAMGGDRIGLSDREMSDTVIQYRQANPSVTSFWKDLEDAAIFLCRNRRALPVKVGKISMLYSDGMLVVRLPSGRPVVYRGMQIACGRDGDRLEYLGVDQKTKKWGRIQTYGGKLAENITQAVARDCLAVAMARVFSMGYPIIFHIHDELVCEVGNGENDLKKIEEVFRTPIPWASGLPLKGAGYLTDYYKKD